MKLSVFSHCAIDTITIGDSNYEQIGGAACYCGITAKQFKFDVDLYSKFGPDFPKQYLSENNLPLSAPQHAPGLGVQSTPHCTPAYRGTRHSDLCDSEVTVSCENTNSLITSLTY